MDVFPAGAGELNPPPGPIAPTHKTLTQVEPRIIINATNTPGDADSLFRIAQSGSYYLTGNINGVAGKRGIEVAADGVTIDLMGHSMIGVAGSLDGIRTDAQLAVAIRNGRIARWGGDGVHILGNSMIIEDITADENSGWGIFLDISYPGSRISGCIAGINTLGGISAPQASVIERCISYANSSAPGIVVGNSARVERCTIWNCNPGIQINSSVISGGGGAFENSMFGCPVGILVTNNDARVERNHIRVANGQVGLRATSAGNSFVDNIVTGAGDKYDFVPGNRLRLIVSQIPESIDWPAEVVLQGNLAGTSGQNGITVNADDVTIDLAGQSLIGVAGSLDGIAVSGSRRNVTVRNGSARAWGGDGVDLTNASSSNVEKVLSSDNLSAGIRTGERAIVRECTTRTNTSDNIAVGGFSQVIDCIADASLGGHGVNATFTQSLVRGCTASGNAMSGVRASQRTLVQNCVCSNNTQHGVHITFAGMVENCFINANVNDGIRMDAGGAVTIRNNTISESSGAGDAGIRVTGASACHVEGNSVTLCNTGVVISVAGNIVVRNSAMLNSANFSIVAGNTAGPVVTPATAAAATNPLANYSN